MNLPTWAPDGIDVPLAGVVHLIPDEADPAGLVGDLIGTAAPGSHLLVSHATFEGLSMVDPGSVFIPLWRPEPDERVEHPERVSAYAGVGRKS